MKPACFHFSIIRISAGVLAVTAVAVAYNAPSGQCAGYRGRSRTGANAEQTLNGVRLVMNGSFRELAYSRLRVMNAAGQELKSDMKVTEPQMIVITFNDRTAQYPVCVDTIFSDADWLVVNP